VTIATLFTSENIFSSPSDFPPAVAGIGDRGRKSNRDEPPDTCGRPKMRFRSLDGSRGCKTWLPGGPAMPAR
jgi:hypothetical protein